MAMDLDDVLALGARLSQLPDRNAYLHAARNEIAQLVPGDDVLWIHAADSAGRGCVVLHGEPWQLDSDFSRRLSHYWSVHPHTQSYTRNVQDRTPRRMSDIVAPRQWREMEEFRALRDGMQFCQLSIIPPAPWRYRGWVICRGQHDFNDSDVDIATGIAPVMATLGPLYERLEAWRPLAESRTNTPGITARELIVLDLLADGLTASAIGRQLRISYRTVEKHLEHIYRKLGCKDRLIAVTLARELGILLPSVNRSDRRVLVDPMGAL
jgi:DNA-binding CsgD family transcriptional regulator